MERKKRKELLILRDIINDRFDITIQVKDRSEDYITGRYFYYKLCREMTRHSYKHIGNVIHIKSHVTVRHSLKNSNIKITDGDLKNYEMALLDAKTHFEESKLPQNLKKMNVSDLVRAYVSLKSEKDKYKTFYDHIQNHHATKRQIRKDIDLILDSFNENLLNDAHFKLKTMLKVSRNMNHQTLRAQKCN